MSLSVVRRQTYGHRSLPTTDAEGRCYIDREPAVGINTTQKTTGEAVDCHEPGHFVVPRTDGSSYNHPFSRYQSTVPFTPSSIETF